MIAYFIYLYFSTCENFYKRVGDMDIENNRNTDKCYMIKPNGCSMKFIDPFFDLSELKGGCKGKWNTKKRFLKYLNKSFQDIYHFYYPRIENGPIKETYSKELFNFIFKNIGGVKENPAKAENVENFFRF